MVFLSCGLFTMDVLMLNRQTIRSRENVPLRVVLCKKWMFFLCLHPEKRIFFRKSFSAKYFFHKFGRDCKMDMANSGANLVVHVRY